MFVTLVIIGAVLVVVFVGGIIFLAKEKDKDTPQPGDD